MDETQVLTLDEKLKVLADSLIGSILTKGVEYETHRKYIFGQLMPKVFQDENYILYKVMYGFKDKGIVLDEEFLKIYLMRNKKLIKDAKQFINIGAYKDLDEDEVLGYISAVLKQYNKLVNLEKMDIDAFRLGVEKYKVEYCNLEMGNAYGKAKSVLYDGLQEGRRFLQGYDDSITYTKKKIAELDAIVNQSAGDGFLDASIVGLTDEEDKKKLVKIGDFGLIKELNEHFGGIYTSLFYSITAPTKGGKSKFTSMLAHNMVVEYGTDIVVWAVEGGYKSWLAQLRAIHYHYMYIRNGGDNTPEAISQNDIIRDDFPSQAVRSLEMASRLDLFTNRSYGNIRLIDQPFNIETFIEDIDTAVRINNAKMVLVDYLQLIGSSGGNSKGETIGKAYQQLLAYARANNVAVMTPAQYKQEVISELARSKDMNSHELRTAGGESSEVVRTPDINIALYSSAEDLMRKEMTVLPIPSRLASPFQSFKMYADLRSCVFASYED